MAARHCPLPDSLAQPNVVGYKPHPVLLADWIYVDIERKKP